MPERLTERFIKSLECPPGKKDFLLFDSVQRGLAVRITRQGGVAFLYQYTRDGRRQRVKLPSGCSLETARQIAREMAGTIHKPDHPAVLARQSARTKEQPESDKLTIRELISQWEKLHLAQKSESHRIEAVRALKNLFTRGEGKERALDQKADNLAKHDLVFLLDPLPPTMRARTQQYGEALFAWAISREQVTNNPFAGIPVPATVKRERILSDQEIRQVWRAAGPDAYGDIIRALILTAQRKDEVSQMRWNEIDGADWSIPRTRMKGKVIQKIPILPELSRIIDRRPRLSEWVFDGGSGKPISGWSKLKLRLDIQSGVTGWRHHDLRRTVSTRMESLRINDAVIHTVLAHKKQGLAGVYFQHRHEIAGALTAWHDLLMSIINAHPGIDTADSAATLQPSG